MNFSPRKNRGGFTLLEIMVALAFVGVLVLAIYSSWYSILKGSRVAREVSDAAQRSRIAMRSVQDALLCARMYNQNNRHYTFLVEPEGDFTSLSFVARLPNSFPRSGRFGDLDLRRLTFTVEAGRDSKRQLVLRQSPILMEPDEDEKEHPLVLAKDISMFLVEFTDLRTGDWVTEWTTTNQLPRKVRITLGLGNKNNFSSTPKEMMVATVSMPAQAIRPEWQAPNRGPAPVQPQPGQPGPTQPGIESRRGGPPPRGAQPGGFGPGGGGIRRGGTP